MSRSFFEKSLCTVIALIFIALTLLMPTAAQAVRPAAQLLPDTTKGCLLVADPDLLIDQFNKTQLGDLLNDPVMQPFREDLKKQLKRKITESGKKVGLTWEDVESVYAGEVALATIQPDGKRKQHAQIVLVDVTGKKKEVVKLRETIHRSQVQKGAKKSTVKVDGTSIEITVYTVKEDGEEETRTLFIHENQLVATDHIQESKNLAVRLVSDDPAEDVLQNVEGFQESQARVAAASGDLVPHVKWFVEPLGYAEVRRARKGGRLRRGTDMLKVVRNQGFDAIQGVGGFVTFATGEQEILHRTMVYAPAIERGDDDASQDKYNLAMRMMQFPLTNNLLAETWVPTEIATYASFNWKIQDAFKYVATIVDEVIGEEGAFSDVKDSLENDPHGPKIDMDGELVKFFGERLTLIADNEVPIHTQSEQLLLAIEVTDMKAVAAGIRKIMVVDPNASESEIDGHIVWQISEEAIVVDGPPEIEGLPLGFPGVEEEFEEEEEDETAPLFPNKAVTVAHDRLFIATNIDLLRRVLSVQRAEGNLADAEDYQLIQTELENLGAGNDSVRFFTRTDESYHAAYELTRQGRMPEAESLLAKMLNRMLESKDSEDEVRDSEIDGANMPDYDQIRKYFGPAGVYMQAEDDGWLFVGSLLHSTDEPDLARVADEGSDSPQ